MKTFIGIVMAGLLVAASGCEYASSQNKRPQVQGAQWRSVALDNIAQDQKEGDVVEAGETPSDETIQPTSTVPNQDTAATPTEEGARFKGQFFVTPKNIEIVTGTTKPKTPHLNEAPKAEENDPSALATIEPVNFSDTNQPIMMSSSNANRVDAFVITANGTAFPQVALTLPASQASIVEAATILDKLVLKCTQEGELISTTNVFAGWKQMADGSGQTLINLGIWRTYPSTPALDQLEQDVSCSLDWDEGGVTAHEDFTVMGTN